jgi:RHS repeat-associated protein
MRSELTSAEITNISGTWSAVYDYHKNGNMDDKTVNSTQTTYEYDWQSPVGDDCHLMTKLTEGSTPITLDYDENGNMRNLPVSGVTTELAYNWDNKLRHGQYDNLTIDLKYDPSGNRIYKDSSEESKPHKYIVDIVGDLPVILMDLEEQSYDIKKIYIYANSQIIAQHDGDTSDDLYFYLHDRLDSVRQIINTSGSVKYRYTYKPFGELFDTAGQDETEETVTDWNWFKFTGQYHDTEIDEYYLRARQYDPYISRFTSRDPVAGKFQEPLTLHAYLYCLNEPINRMDPWGLMEFTIPGAGWYYDVRETQILIDVATAWVGIKFWKPWVGATKVFSVFDYKDKFDPVTHRPYRFQLPDMTASLIGSEFSNYLAGYATYYHWGMVGEGLARAFGNAYETGRWLWGDDLESIYWITKGALDANVKRREYLRHKFSPWNTADRYRLMFNLELAHLIADLRDINIAM